MRFTRLRRQIEELLLRDDPLRELEIFISEHTEGSPVLPLKSLVSPLRSLFMCSNELIRWRSISALGYVASCIARHSLEDVRIIMRQLMWTLNDESGGIGWGSPEAMAEIMVSVPLVRDEYISIILSYVTEDGNFLEYPPLRNGALWGIMRLSVSAPHSLLACKSYDVIDVIAPYASNILEDDLCRFLAFLILFFTGHIERDKLIQHIMTLRGPKIRIYSDYYFHTVTTSDGETTGYFIDNLRGRLKEY